MPVEFAVKMLSVHYNRFSVDHPRISAPVIPAGVRTNRFVQYGPVPVDLNAFRRYCCVPVLVELSDGNDENLKSIGL